MGRVRFFKRRTWGRGFLCKSCCFTLKYITLELPILKGYGQGEGGLRTTQVYIGEFKSCIPVGGGGLKQFQKTTKF